MKAPISFLPNVITILRFGLAGLFPYAYFRHGTGQAVLLFIAAVFSDIVDGYLARKYDLTSRVGSALDPLADKVLVIVTVVCLLVDSMIPFIVALIIIIREVLMIVAGCVGYFVTTSDISSDRFGKVSAVIMSSYLIAILLKLPNILQCLLLVILFCSLLFATTHYAVRFLAVLRDAKLH